MGFLLKLSEIRDKEIININNGERMGYAYDFELDLDQGIIVGIVMSGTSKVLGFFGKSEDLIIDWQSIVKIGTDTILVDYDNELKG